MKRAIGSSDNDPTLQQRLRLTPPSTIITQQSIDSTFSPSENIESNYIILEEVLGEGQYGIVKKGTRRSDNTVVAIKIIPKRKESFEMQLIQEASILKSVDHIAIVKMYDFFEDESNYYIVMELIQGGELFHRIVKRSHYSEKDARDV
eukprot:gene12565-16851_t